MTSLVDMSPGLQTILGLAITSPLMVSVFQYLTNKKKDRAEVDNTIGNSYHLLLESYQAERNHMLNEMTDLRSGQKIYIENSTQLLKTNLSLKDEINKLKDDHSECNKKNADLTDQMNKIAKKLDENGIK